MEDIIKEVLNFIQTTGNILIKAGFELTVRQVVAEAVIGLIGLLIIILFVGILIFNASKKLKKVRKVNVMFQDYDDYHPLSKSATMEERELFAFWRQVEKNDFLDKNTLPVYISGLWLTIFLLLAFAIPSYILVLLNPQWYAIEKIINLVK